MLRLLAVHKPQQPVKVTDPWELRRIFQPNRGKEHELRKDGHLWAKVKTGRIILYVAGRFCIILRTLPTKSKESNPPDSAAFLFTHSQNHKTKTPGNSQGFVLSPTPWGISFTKFLQNDTETSTYLEGML